MNYSSKPYPGEVREVSGPSVSWTGQAEKPMSPYETAVTELEFMLTRLYESLDGLEDQLAAFLDGGIDENEADKEPGASCEALNQLYSLLRRGKALEKRLARLRSRLVV